MTVREVYALRVWQRFNRRLDLEDLDSQASLLRLQGKRGWNLWCDIFDYAEKEYRRRPLPRENEPAVEWVPRCYVRRAVEQLPPRQREAIHLVFFEDYRRAEAAREMQITKGAVTHLMDKAFGTLRSRLA